MGDIFRRTLAMLTGAAGKGKVRLTSEIDPRIPDALLGDAVRLRQILVNLLGNAIKFSAGRPAAQVSLSARLIELGPDRARIEMSIEDNGIGMDAATVARLYRPFSQADVSTTRRFGGTGLGLTITRHFIELMGGDIEVRSTPEVGSVFTVRVSLAVAAAATSQDRLTTVRAPEESAVIPARKPRRPERVLVAEDNDINQEVVVRQLHLLGFDAEVARNGREALELWRTRRFAIVLTDLQMPEMDGYGLAAAIRSEEGTASRIPIVALTANALKNEASRCRAAGMDDYLTKPARLDTLEASFNRLLAHDASPAAATQAEPPARHSEPVNPAVLAGQFGEGAELLGEIFLDFAQASREASTSLHAALRGGDWDAVAALAHRTKDSARSVGAVRLGDLCAELESGAYDRDQQSVSGVWRVFEHEVRAVRDWIETRYGDGSIRSSRSSSCGSTGLVR